MVRSGTVGFAALVIAVTAVSSFAFLHVDFEPPDAYFESESYYEDSVKYKLINVGFSGTAPSRGLSDTAYTGNQAMWLRVPGNPTVSQDATKMSRQEYPFGSFSTKQNVWWSIALMFGEEHENTKWYGTILHQVRYDGSGYGFDLGMYLDKDGDPSGPIPLAYRRMEGNTLSGAAYDSGIKRVGFSFERERWYHVIANFYLDPDGGTGFWHMWIDGEKVIDLNNIKTGVKDGKIRFGQYGRREQTNRFVRFDDFRQGASREEVEATVAIDARPDFRISPQVTSGRISHSGAAHIYDLRGARLTIPAQSGKGMSSFIVRLDGRDGTIRIGR